MTVGMDKILVTCDRMIKKYDTFVALWEFDSIICLGETGQWESRGASRFLRELSPEEFKKEYKLDAPAPGEKKTLVAAYSWEEE